MAYWIWYPHDFEIDLRGKVEAKRTEHGMVVPSIWRMDAPTRAVAFIKNYSLEKAGKAIGYEVRTTEMSMSELLSYYYRQQDRSEYDLFFLATNFTQVFDPYYNYHTDDAYQGVYNRSGLKDEKLMELAKAMRETTPGDSKAYLEAWQNFIAYWQEVMPAVSLVPECLL